MKKILRRIASRVLEKRSIPNGWSWPSGSIAGHQPVSPQLAESLSAVFAGVSAIASSMAALSVHLYQVDGKNRVEVLAGPFPDLVQNAPNRWQTWFDLIEMLMSQVLLFGNGLVEIETDQTGELAGLRVIPWNWINPQLLPNGRLVYDVFDQPGLYGGQPGKRRRLLEHEVIHVRDRSDDGIIGKSRLQRCSPVLHAALAVHNFAADSFREGFRPGGMLRTPENLHPTQKQELHDAVVKGFGRSNNSARVMVCSGEMDWKNFESFSPESLELLESRRFTTEEICRILQIPPQIIADHSRSTFTNSETAGRWFAQFCLLPWARKLEAAFNRALFAGTDYAVSFDLSAFDRGDPETRWKNHAIAAQHGILDTNEIREIEGWSPREKAEAGQHTGRT